MINYLDIIRSYINNPRDVSTKPTTNRTGKWFCVYVENGKIVVDAAKEKTPKCSINVPRVLLEKEMDAIYSLYVQRKQGHSVSKQAAEVTRNQVYWYGIFNDMGL